jgi:hypothetical protein
MSAGSASRVYNFCRNFPNSPGCYQGPPVPPRTCPPYSIGTASGCSQYDIFYLKDDFGAADVTLGPWAGPIEDTTIKGVINSYIVPIYPGIYNSSGPPPTAIGYYTSITQATDYTGTGDSYMATDNANFYWMQDNECVASIATTYDYNGSEMSGFFRANSEHYYNSTTCGRQLLNKSASFKLVVDSSNQARQIKITIKNKY